MTILFFYYNGLLFQQTKGISIGTIMFNYIRAKEKYDKRTDMVKRNKCTSVLRYKTVNTIRDHQKVFNMCKDTFK